MLCRSARISIKSYGRKNRSVAKKDRLSEISLKNSEIFEDIFEDFEPPSKNFLATPLIWIHDRSGQ